MDHEHRSHTLLALPTKLLVYIISLVTSLRERVKLRYVSRRLQCACETPSLWREFVWPYYHTEDEGCVNSVLKVCGEHVKQLSFPDMKMPTSQLLSTMAYCCNTVSLRLPSTALNSELLDDIFTCMGHLQTLDIRWDRRMEQLLEAINHKCIDMKELTIRDSFMIHASFTGAGDIELWVKYWMETGFIPHKINFVFSIDNKVTNLLLIESHKSMSNLMCGCGILKFYNTFKVPMDLVPVFPVFQVEIGQTATLPLVNDCIWGYSEPDLLLLADCTRNNQVIYKASLRRFLSVQLNRTFTDFALVTEFDTSYCNLYSDHLKRLAIACPNLQRLNLRQNEHCLKKLQGLCTIARTCLSLQGLNLKEVSAEDVEDQIELWVILSNMKLTHLAVDVCILLSSIEENKTELAGLFQKCQSLQVLETSVSSCNSCASTFLNNSLSVVSHFQALIYYMYSEAHNQIHYCATALHDIVTSCKQLKCLLFQEKYSSIRRHHLTVSNCSTLEQLSIYSSNFDVPTDFMASISSHGGLVHVKMQVKSVTSEGIAVLVTNSPNLLTFHAFVDDDSHLEQSLKVKMPDRKLFKCGDYKVAERFSGISLQQIYEPCSESADLELFWW